MNKIDKFLRKLRIDDRVVILKVLSQIYSGQYNNLDIKKLKGNSGVYRVRVGRVRIIFTKTSGGIKVDSMEFRNDKTY